MGRRLLLKVEDIMHGGDSIPRVSESTTLDDALMEITTKGLGMTCIVDADNTLLGIFTDGDLRRVLDDEINIHQTRIKEIMTRNCITISRDILAAEALHIMEENKITALVAVDKQQRPDGIVHLHDMLRAGVA